MEQIESADRLCDDEGVLFVRDIALLSPEAVAYVHGQCVPTIILEDFAPVHPSGGPITFETAVPHYLPAGKQVTIACAALPAAKKPY
jgi:hypothetical protein